MPIVLSLMMLAAIALVGGAFVLWRRGGSLLQIGLMLLVAVLFNNFIRRRFALGKR